ncbi:alpha/beta fold hydrolase [Pollutimonas bauzanensis]|nr:alpha/beta hydrolase [Pollutimonas bauzanensis]
MIRGVRAYYECAGRGVPILLLHTAGRDGRQWHRVMETLGDRYRLYAPDLPGHGKSYPLASQPCLDTVDHIAEWLREFSAAVGIEQFVVMGCSVGGNLALLMAAKFSEVLAVIALQGAARTPTFTEKTLELFTHPQVNLMHSNMDFSMSLVGSKADDFARSFSEWGVQSITPLAQQADLRAYTRCDTRDVLNRVTCPVLIARGTEDWLVTSEMVQEALYALNGTNHTEFHALNGLGHFPHLEAPEVVSKMTDDFLVKHLAQDQCSATLSTPAASI